jgi:hypothetical protein
VREGDRVWAHDPATGQNVLREVTATHTVAEGGAVYHIFAAGERLEATGSHPFLAVGRWEDASRLRPGDSLWLYQGGWAVVDSVGVRPGPATTYNLSVQGLPTFYVSRTGVLVHNCPDGSGTSKKSHKNKNDAVGNYAVYDLIVKFISKDPERWKIGKADLDRLRGGMTPERIAQQIAILKKYLPGVEDVTYNILATVNKSTTDAAKLVEDFFAKTLKSPQKTTDRKKLKAMKAASQNGTTGQ